MSKYIRMGCDVSKVSAQNLHFIEEFVKSCVPNGLQLRAVDLRNCVVSLGYAPKSLKLAVIKKHSLPQKD